MDLPGTSKAPPPPAGYGAPYRFEYPQLGLTIASLVLFLALVPGLWRLMWWLQGQPAASSLSLGGWGVLIFLLSLGVVPLATIVAHELIHGLIYRLLGYRVSYGIYWKLGAYAAAFGQFQRRDHNMLVALGPLVLISVAMLPLLAVSDSALALVALVALLVNTSGAVGDLYLFWRMLWMPRATLSYDLDVQNMFVYEPQD